MAEENNQRPIIIVKKKKGGHEHHGGAWKVAFADFMTAMFALFLVLWILTQSQEVKSAIASYFRHPTDYEGRPDAMLRGSEGLNDAPKSSKNMIDSTEDTKKAGTGPGSEQGLDVLSLIGVPDARLTADVGLRPEPVEHPEIMEKDEVATFVEIIDELWKKLGLDPAYQTYKDSLSLEALEEGMLIQIVAQKNLPLFEDGTNTFKPAIKHLLESLAKKLNALPNKIEISGHCTIIPKSSSIDKLWMSSVQMAEAARLELEKAGFPPALIAKISGGAYAHPLIPHPKNDDQKLVNQRISILVHPKQWVPDNF